MKRPLIFRWFGIPSYLVRCCAYHHFSETAADRYRERSLGGEKNAALLLHFLDVNGKLETVNCPSK